MTFHLVLHVPTPPEAEFQHTPGDPVVCLYPGGPCIEADGTLNNVSSGHSMEADAFIKNIGGSNGVCRFQAWNDTDSEELDHTDLDVNTGQTVYFTVYFTMPDHDINIRLIAYHQKDDGTWEQDDSEGCFSGGK